MKHIQQISTVFILLTLLFSQSVNAQVSGSADIPRIMSYQGQITTTDGKVMNGIHKITATLYSDPHGTNSVWLGEYSTEIANGIFTVILGSGKSKLPENSLMNQPLWVGIRVDGSEEMQPLSQLAAAPYALNVPDQSITLAKLAPDVVLGAGKTPTIEGISFDPCHTNNDGGINTNFIGGGCRNVSLSSYDVVSGGDTNKVDTVSGYSSIVGGYLNYIRGAKSIIAGGETNRIDSASHSFIGSGSQNIVSAPSASIVGGDFDTVSGQFGFIGGGTNNKASGDRSVVGGGIYNIAAGATSVIPGGTNLKVGTGSFGFNSGSVSQINVTSSPYISFWGNVDMWLQNTDGTPRKLKFFDPTGTNFTSFKANALGQGGSDIDYELPASQGAALDVLANNGSGILYWENVEDLGSWMITGNSNADPATGHFLGTTNNKALELHVYDGDGTTHEGDKRVVRYEPQNESPNIIGGFQGNSIPGGFGNVICGGGCYGNENYIWDGVHRYTSNDSGHYCFIGGGKNNQIQGDIDFEDGLDYNVIVGGKDNLIWDDLSFIGGGDSNFVGEDHSVIVGGHSNTSSAYGVVGGGANNITAANYSSIVGGMNNQIYLGSGANFGFGTICGGSSGFIICDYSTICGGQNNKIGSLGAFATTATHMTIPGGNNLIAQSYAQTVVGAYNRYLQTGLSDSSNYLSSSRGNDRILIIGNGTDNSHRHNAFEVANNGHSIVYHNDGYNVANNTTSATPSFAAIEGARYIDNTPIAWGKVSAAGTLQMGFGVSSASIVGGTTSTYLITLNYTDPYFGAQVQIAHGSSVTATISGTAENTCFNIAADPVAWDATNLVNTVTIKTSHRHDTQDPSTKIVTWSCAEDPSAFMFVVYGRP